MGRTVTIAEPSVEPSLSVPMCWASFKIQCAYLPDDGFSGSIVFPRPMQYARQQVIESLELNRKLLSLVIPVILGESSGVSVTALSETTRTPSNPPCDSNAFLRSAAVQTSWPSLIKALMCPLQVAAKRSATPFPTLRIAKVNADHLYSSAG